MKIFWLIVGMLVMLAALFFGGFALGTFTDGSSGAGLFLLGLVPLAVLSVAPMTTGSIVAQWPVDPREAQGRPYFVRLVVIVGTITVACAILLTVFLRVVNAPEAAVTLAPAGAILLTTAAFPLGEWLRRREARHPRPELVFEGVNRDDLRKKVRRIITTFVIGFVATTVVCFVIFRFAGAPKHRPPLALVLPTLGLGLSFGALAAMMATIAVVLPLNRALRDTLGTDLATRKDIGRVVVKGRAQDLAPEAEERAARYAAVASVSMPFQLAQQLLLFVALLAQRAVSIGDGDDIFPGFSVGFIIFFAVVLAIVVPLNLRNIGRVRRYAAAHPAPRADAPA